MTAPVTPVKGGPPDLEWHRLTMEEREKIRHDWADCTDKEARAVWNRMPAADRWQIRCAQRGRDGSFDREVQRVAENVDPETDAAFEGLHAVDPLDLGIVRMDTVPPERIDWLWPGRIPLGKLTIVEGDPKVGKSTLMLDIAARVTTGTALPDGHEPNAGTVLVMTAEDGLADTVRPRLDAAGADPARVIAWESVPIIDEHGVLASERPPSIPRDLERLERLIERHTVSLVIVDVLNAYLGADVNGHVDQDVRRALMPLAKLAERTCVAVVVLRHLNKSTGGPAIYRGGGSIGIGGAARSILLVSADPEDESRRILASQGSNVAATPEALAYELVDTPEHGCATVRWLGVSPHTAGSLLAAGSSEDQDRLTEACEVLTDLLLIGPLGARDVMARTHEAGVSRRTLDRAKAHLGVKSRKRGAGGWEWYLPEPMAEDRRAQGGNVGNVGNVPRDQEVQTVEDRQETEDRQDRQGPGAGGLPMVVNATTALHDVRVIV